MIIEIYGLIRIFQKNPQEKCVFNIEFMVLGFEMLNLLFDFENSAGEP